MPSRYLGLTGNSLDESGRGGGNDSVRSGSMSILKDDDDDGNKSMCSSQVTITKRPLTNYLTSLLQLDRLGTKSNSPSINNHNNRLDFEEDDSERYMATINGEGLRSNTQNCSKASSILWISSPPHQQLQGGRRAPLAEDMERWTLASSPPPPSTMAATRRPSDNEQKLSSTDQPQVPVQTSPSHPVKPVSVRQALAVSTPRLQQFYGDGAETPKGDYSQHKPSPIPNSEASSTATSTNKKSKNPLSSLFGSLARSNTKSNKPKAGSEKGKDEAVAQKNDPGNETDDGCSKRIDKPLDLIQPIQTEKVSSITNLASMNSPKMAGSSKASECIVSYHDLSGGVHCEGFNMKGSDWTLAQAESHLSTLEQPDLRHRQVQNIQAMKQRKEKNTESRTKGALPRTERAKDSSRQLNVELVRKMDERMNAKAMKRMTPTEPPDPQCISPLTITHSARHVTGYTSPKISLAVQNSQPSTRRQQQKKSNQRHKLVTTRTDTPSTFLGNRKSGPVLSSLNETKHKSASQVLSIPRSADKVVRNYAQIHERTEVNPKYSTRTELSMLARGWNQPSNSAHFRKMFPQNNNSQTVSGTLNPFSVPPATRSVSGYAF